jgi:predicted Zn-dependent protease
LLTIVTILVFALFPLTNLVMATCDGGDKATRRVVHVQQVATADEWAAWALLTDTALKRDRNDAAIVCADRAVALASRNPLPLILRAKCLYLPGKAREAFDATEAAESIIGNARSC